MSIATFDSVVEFIQHLLQSNASMVTLVLCSTREAFIDELYADIQQSIPQEQPNSPVGDSREEETEAAEADGQEEEKEEEEERYTENKHWILYNTLESVSRSERIRVVFCPAIEHLRAYLGCSFRPRKKQDGDGEGGNSLYQDAVLAIVNMVSIHSCTAEFSAQGLSRTSALAVEAAAREKVRLVLCECTSTLDEDAREHGRGIWDVQIPLLSSMGEGLSGVNTVQVKQVMSKWFLFDEDWKQRVQ